MIELLHKLRTIEPDNQTMHAIKMRVDARVRDLESQRKVVASPYFSFSHSAKFFLFPAMAFSFLFAFSLYTNGSLETTKLSIKIAQADDAHAKSQLALSALDAHSDSIILAMNDPVAIATLSRSIDLSTKTLDGLMLMGEVGKYTQAECLSDYQNFHDTLEELLLSMQSAPEPLSAREQAARKELISQISQALEIAEKKLGDYPPIPNP